MISKWLSTILPNSSASSKAFANAIGLIFQVSGSESINTGSAPSYIIGLTVAAKVSVEQAGILAKDEINNARATANNIIQQARIVSEAEKEKMIEEAKQQIEVEKVINDIVEKVGKEKAEEIVQLFTLISNKAKEVVDHD